MTDSASLLRERGLHATNQRQAVLAAVADHPHATAELIAEQVRERLGSVSRQAVYNALATLAEAGLIRRIQPEGSPARFESRVGDNHHHLVCRACGIVVDVDCAVGHTPCLTPTEAAGFQIDTAEVAYWGRCPTCATTTASPKPRT